MRTLALAISTLALVVGCTRERGDLAGTATTTSALASSSSPRTPAGCSPDLSHVLEFEGTSAELSPDERVDVQSWAKCLSLPEMSDSTVVLLGPGSAADETLFARRAAAVRDELTRRGVERSRVLIGPANAARAGGRLGPANVVQVELSGTAMLREMNERR